MAILAGIRDYFFRWQLPLFGLFAAAWLIGGPYLTRRALRRFTELPRSRQRMGRCAQLNFFATGGGLVALVVVAGFFAVVAKEVEFLPLALLGAGVGLPVMLAMSWAVASVALELPVKTLFRVTVSTTGPLGLALVLIATTAFVPAWYVRQEQLARARCRANLQFIHGALLESSRRGQQPGSLKELLKAGLVEAGRLGCPAKPDIEVGYLYAPSLPVGPADGSDRQQALSEKIWVCDRRGNHGATRLVLYADGRILELEEGEFDRLLQRPENLEFKKLIEAER